MKIRQAKKIMKYKPLRPGEKTKIKYRRFTSKYWRNKFILYSCTGIPCDKRHDHRITKAINLKKRSDSRKVRNEAKKLLKTNPFKERDLKRGFKQLKRYSL